MQLSEVIRDISDDLNDQVPGHEYTRWPVKQLQTYVQEALVAASLQLKDLFTNEVVAEVKPGGGWQEVCEDCAYIRRIIGESDANGNVLRYLSRSADVESNTWPGAITRCEPDPKDYVMTGYSVSTAQLNRFRVSPPLPPGQLRYVLIQCYKKPSSIDLSGDVPDEVVAAVKQWALYRALSVDSENNQTVVELAQAHYKAYSDLIAVVAREREKQNADNTVRAVQKPPAE